MWSFFLVTRLKRQVGNGADHARLVLASSVVGNGMNELSSSGISFLAPAFDLFPNTVSEATEAFFQESFSQL